jgi:hypothetical protein
MNSLARLHELATKSQRQVEEVKRRTAQAGGAAMVGAGGVAAYRALNPSVGITYGKTNAYRGHLSHAENVKKILDSAGVKSSMHNSDVRGWLGSQRHSAMVNTGFGPNIAGAEKIGFKADYSSAKDSVLPVMPEKQTKPLKTGKRTMGVYGGGGGVDISTKIPHLAKVHGDFDAIHLYAGPKAKDVKPGYAGGGYDEAMAAVEKLRAKDPAAASKFRVHGPMKQKAILNATRAHSINVGNAGASTMHEIIASQKPGMIWQAGKYPSKHYRVNEDLAHSRGARVARGADDLARNEDALHHIRHIMRDKAHAEGRQREVAETMMKEGAESRAKFVNSVKGALKRSRVRNAVAAAGLGLGGGGLIAAASMRDSKKKKKS